MITFGNTWAIVLVGGEDSRLHSLTTTALGDAVPKQFCSLRGGTSLLLEALKRAEAVSHACLQRSFLSCPLVPMNWSLLSSGYSYPFPSSGIRVYPSFADIPSSFRCGSR
jgi:hypothetical protein